MALGVLKSYPNNPDVAKAQIAAAYNDLEFDFEALPMDQTKTPEYLAKFPMGKVPVLSSPTVDLFESSAIGYYAASAKDNSPLLGLTHADKALIMQWVMFAQAELSNHIREWVAPLRGVHPYLKPAVDTAIERVKRALGALNSALQTKTYLVGESVTYADICIVTTLVRLYTNVLDKPLRDQYKNVTRYYTTLINKDKFKKYLGDLPLCETPLKYMPPKKEKKPAAAAEKKKQKQKQQQSDAPKQKDKEEAAAASKEEEKEGQPKPAPKPKSALDSLPPSKLKMDDWKRMYSNNDTAIAMPWLWEHLDDGYSLWRVDYKYNDELTLVFMSNNLIGGFFARLERARKYAFGSMIVTGTNNNNAISGYFLIRGQEVPEEVYDAADFDSYTFTKVDPSQYDEKKDEIFKYMAWEVDGFADGKIFK